MEFQPWNRMPWCPICERRHAPEHPHDQGSDEWREWFTEVYDRQPAWSDAMRHCPPGMKAYWREQLIKLYVSRGQEVPSDLWD